MFVTLRRSAPELDSFTYSVPFSPNFFLSVAHQDSKILYLLIN